MSMSLLRVGKQGTFGEESPTHIKATAHMEWGGVVVWVQTAEEMKDFATFQIVL